MDKPIPDNVTLEPHCEMIKMSKNQLDTPVLEHYINFTPSIDTTSDARPLKVLNVKKLDKEDAKKNQKNYVSTIETQVQKNRNVDYNLFNDYDSSDFTTGCGIGSILNPFSTKYFNPQTQSNTIFYANYDINDLDSHFTTLKANDETNVNEIKKIDNEYTKIITKHTAKNHRSEIEINNCKLNSSASSTISSSTSIDRKVIANSDKSMNKATFRTKEDVENFFDLTNTNGDDLESSDDFNNKLDSSLSSFESIDKEKIKEEIKKEYSEGHQIKYKFNKKRRGINFRRIKKVLGSRHIRLPPDL